MRELFFAVAVIIVWAGGGFTQSRKARRPVSPSEQPLVNIFQIDFKNYTFPLNGKSYKLINGFYAETSAPATQWGLEMADGPYYGDLTGDRREEAAFVLRYGLVSAPGEAEARVYTLVNGKPALLATFQIADGAACELDHYMSIEDGTIIVERIYGSGALCDHNEITQYRWNGTEFVQVGEVKRARCRCM